MKGEAEDIGMLIKQIDEKLKKKGNAYFSGLGITISQIQVLHFIDMQPQKKTTQKALEDFCGVSHPTINGIIKRLEEKSFVETSITTNGRLSKEVRMTDEGAALLKKTKKSKSLTEKMITKNFENQDINLLRSMLKKIIYNLSD